jgi:putative colanic acid biosynthesis acetyltransferase WcaF
MCLGAYSWICARAAVAPGVRVGEGAILGLGSVASNDLEPWTVYSGIPALKVKVREKVFSRKSGPNKRGGNSMPWKES